MELTISWISFLTTVDSSGVMLCCVFQAFKALQRPLQKEREKWSWKELVLELEGVAFAPKADLSWSYAAAFEMGDLHGYDGYELRIFTLWQLWWSGSWKNLKKERQEKEEREVPEKVIVILPQGAVFTSCEYCEIFWVREMLAAIRNWGAGMHWHWVQKDDQVSTFHCRRHETHWNTLKHDGFSHCCKLSRGALVAFIPCPDSREVHNFAECSAFARSCNTFSLQIHLEIWSLTSAPIAWVTLVISWDAKCLQVPKKSQKKRWMIHQELTI